MDRLAFGTDAPLQRVLPMPGDTGLEGNDEYLSTSSYLAMIERHLKGMINTWLWPKSYRLEYNDYDI